MGKRIFLKMMLAVMFGASSVSVNVSAQSLAAWVVPNTESSWLTELAAVVSDDNLTITPLIRGTGLTNSGTVAANSFGGRADQTTLDAAIADGDYYTMSVRAKQGYKMSLTGIPVWRTRAAGVNTENTCSIYVQYALDDGTFANAGSINVTSTTGNNQPLTFSEDTQTALSNLTSETELTLRFVVVVSSARNVYIITGDESTNRFVLGGTIVENTTTIAQWNGYTQGTQPADGVFLATGGNVSNNNAAALKRDGAGIISNTPSDGVATSRAWSAGSYWEATFSTTGYKDLKLTSRQMGSNTGPKDFALQYRIGTDTWKDVADAPSIVVGTSYTSGSFANLTLPGEMNNQSSVSLRWIVTSDVSINNGTVTSTGTNRLDAVIIGKISASIYTHIESVENAQEISARYYSLTGVEVPATTKGILIKRALFSNGKIKTGKILNK